MTLGGFTLFDVGTHDSPDVMIRCDSCLSVIALLSFEELVCEECGLYHCPDCSAPYTLYPERRIKP